MTETNLHDKFTQTAKDGSVGHPNPNPITLSGLKQEGVEPNITFEYHPDDN